MIILVLRWTDDKGSQQTKEYTDEPTARKAKAWLLERGVASVDIAIRMQKRNSSA